jgi:hypothetical protein
MTEQRLRVLGPKDNTYYVFCRERDLEYFPAEGSDHTRASGSDTVHEPLRMQRGDVGSPAGGNDVHVRLVVQPGPLEGIASLFTSLIEWYRTEA